MSDDFDKSRLANERRKSGQYREALALYREMWNEHPGPYVAAGLLHCLRKQALYEEALSFCDQIPRQYITLDWCRSEIVWTLIQARLEKVDEVAPLETVTSLAESILALGPKDSIARWCVLRRVLKTAKTRSRWDVISKWIGRVNPDELSATPMKDERGREGWSDQAVWQNYHIRCMIETGNKEDAISFARKAIDHFPRQRVFFTRLEALATVRLKRLIEAEQIYGTLCGSARQEWWILHEYAQVVRELGKPQDALRLMCKAASSHGRLDALVTLFSDIGFLCSELGLREEARHHLFLCKSIREEHGWSVPISLITALSRLDAELPGACGPSNRSNALAACKAFWLHTLGPHDDPRVQSLTARQMRRSLRGELKLSHPDRPFGFIVVKGGDSYFCPRSDLPEGATNATTLVFDGIPSFDKKKNRDSWRAINIRLA